MPSRPLARRARRARASPTRGSAPRRHRAAPRRTLDIDGARRERYPAPGALPDVEPGTLDDDLARRDFTVNAMALRLVGPGPASSIDPHGGAGGPATPASCGSCGRTPSRRTRAALVRAARYAGAAGVHARARDRARPPGAPRRRSTPARRGWPSELRRLLEEEDAAAGLRPAARPRRARGSPTPAGAGRGRRRPTARPAGARRAAVGRCGSARRSRRTPADRAALPGWAVATARELRDGMAAAARARRRRAGRPRPIARCSGRCARRACSARSPSAGRPSARWWAARPRPRARAIDGADLVAAGVAPGPAIGRALAAVRAAVLDGDGRRPRRAARTGPARRPGGAVTAPEADRDRDRTPRAGGRSPPAGAASAPGPSPGLNLGSDKDDPDDNVRANRAPPVRGARARRATRVEANAPGARGARCAPVDGPTPAGPVHRAPARLAGGGRPRDRARAGPRPGGAGRRLPAGAALAPGRARRRRGPRGLARAGGGRARRGRAGARRPGAASGAAIGPGIGPCCYPVSPDVRDALRAAGSARAVVAGDGRGPGRRGARRRCVAAGVPAAAVADGRGLHLAASRSASSRTAATGRLRAPGGARVGDGRDRSTRTRLREALAEARERLDAAAARGRAAGGRGRAGARGQVRRRPRTRPRSWMPAVRAWWARTASRTSRRRRGAGAGAPHLRLHRPPPAAQGARRAARRAARPLGSTRRAWRRRSRHRSEGPDAGSRRSERRRGANQRWYRAAPTSGVR